MVGTSASTTTVHGRPPLAFAAAFGYRDLAIELLKKGADVNQCEGLAFRDALLHGHTDMAQLLLGIGAKPSLCAPHWLIELRNKIMHSALQEADDDLTSLIENGVLDWVNQALRMLLGSPNHITRLERAKKLLACGTTNGKLLVKQALANRDAHMLRLLLKSNPSSYQKSFPIPHLK